MRTLFLLWAAPLLFFWGWFGLSYYDMNFGYVLMTREAHDLIFKLYGDTLGIDPTTIPWMIAKACVFDFFLIMAIWAYRRRREIAGWVRRVRAGQSEAAPVAGSPESL